MKISVFADSGTVATEAAQRIAGLARDAVEKRGRFVMAVSGGKTPWAMLRALAGFDVPWKNVYVVQVDERVAPDDHEDRNATHLRETLGSVLGDEHILAMPVEADDLEIAAVDYAEALGKLAGIPPVLDLVHLGLGGDGHTASLFPGDPALTVADRDVAVTDIHHKRQRMTLTYPLLNRARTILWVVTGVDKAPMVKRLRVGDDSIPAGRVRQEGAEIFMDRGASSGRGPGGY
jgi:6-phosphogluconolactonase